MVVVLGYTTFNLLRKNEKQEEHKETVVNENTTAQADNIQEAAPAPEMIAELISEPSTPNETPDNTEAPLSNTNEETEQSPQ